MGNTRSEIFEPVSVDLWWNNDQTEPEAVQINQQTINKANEAKMEEIKQEISSLHEKRLRLIAEKKKEMDGLRQELARHKKQNEELKEFITEKGYEPPIQEWDTTKIDVSLQTETFEVPGGLDPEELGKIKGKNLELQINIAEIQKELQSANSELSAFETERKEYKTHVTALKDIITVSKQLLLMREKQIKEQAQKLTEIQASLAERERLTFSEDLRQEYQRQLQNIKQLRGLYEERQRADKTERDNLKSQLEEAQSSLKTQETKNTELQERVDELEKDTSNKYDTLINLESQLGLTKAECGELRAEMSVINQLFSQILLGFNNGQDVDMDKLIKTLEENHDLLTEIVINEESNESSALPKVLLDLVSQVNEKSKLNLPINPQEETNSEQGLALETINEESESQTSSTQQNSLSSASEIVQNLPKVWKILTELLSHQTAPISVLNENNDQPDINPCYKSVETPTGPAMAISVSKTFIRLKNLIVEKKSLEKETTRLKQLNTHLETRLQDQEKRLEMVSHELSKTWHVVGKMQKQHQQLHTQEKILRYELAQKRKLLNELKEELEYCREKWMQAREKNSTTEEQWKQLRNEFAARKNTVSEDLNNSVESGYSDDRESSSEDDVEEDKTPKIPEGEGVDDSSIPEEGNQTILKVVKEEIAKIENNPQASTSTQEESGSTEQEEETQKNEAISIENYPSTSSNDIPSTSEAIVASTIEENCDLSSALLTEDTSFVSEDIGLENTSSPSSDSVDQILTSMVETEEERIMGDSPSVPEILTTPSLMVQTEEDSVKSIEPEESALPSSDLVNQEDLALAAVDEASTSSSPSDMIDQVLTSAPIQEDLASAAVDGASTSSSPSDMVDQALTPAPIQEDLASAVVDGASTSSSLMVQIEEDGVMEDPLSSASLDEGNKIVTPLMVQTEKDNEEVDSSIVNVFPTSSTMDQKLEDGSEKEEVHLTETLKTDLVQNQEVQKEAPKTHEEILIAREERLKKLEEQAKDLITQRTNTSNRSVEICTKLDDLHQQYGGDQKSRRKDIDDIYKKLEEDILQTIKKTKGGEEYPSTSRQSRNTEEILAANEERLKCLEEVLVDQSPRGEISKLEQNEIKEQENIEDSTCRLEEDPEPSTSSTRTPEEILARREERLQQMEEQAQQLVSKARRNSLRNVQIWRKLNKLHDRYGESSDSSDDGADDNNNNNADGVEAQDRVEDVTYEAQVDLEETENDAQRGEEEKH